MSVCLEAEDLIKRFGGRTVVDGVTLSVRPGEVVGLLGPNGAGKTTVFKLILGLLPTDGGAVRFGETLDGLPLYQRARRGLGYLPQGPSIFRGLTVAENLKVVLEARKKKGLEQDISVLLGRFKLHHLADQKARLLSGGERRKLEFARALSAEPRILLCDEPFAGVDPIAAEAIAETVRQLRDQGIGVLITDHNVDDALGVCDRVHILVDGRLVESGTPAEIRKNERIQQLYLGRRPRPDLSKM